MTAKEARFVVQANGSLTLMIVSGIGDRLEFVLTQRAWAGLRLTWPGDAASGSNVAPAASPVASLTDSLVGWAE